VVFQIFLVIVTSNVIINSFQNSSIVYLGKGSKKIINPCFYIFIPVCIREAFLNYASILFHWV